MFSAARIQLEVERRLKAKGVRRASAFEVKETNDKDECLAWQLTGECFRKLKQSSKASCSDCKGDIEENEKTMQTEYYNHRCSRWW